MSHPNPDLPPSPLPTPKRPSLRPPNVQKDIYHTCQNNPTQPLKEINDDHVHDFHHFQDFPAEIQNLIWTHAARQWASDNLHTEHCASWGIWPTPYIVLYAERDHGFELPAMLWTCSAARNATLDDLFILGTDEGWMREEAKVTRSEGNLYIFLGEDGWPEKEWGCEQEVVLAYGLRIQDFRNPGLQGRLDEEDERIREQQADIDELARWWQAFEDEKTEEELEEMGIGEYPNVKRGSYFHMPLFPAKRRGEGLAKGQTSFGGFDENFSYITLTGEPRTICVDNLGNWHVENR